MRAGAAFQEHRIRLIVRDLLNPGRQTGHLRRVAAEQPWQRHDAEQRPDHVEHGGDGKGAVHGRQPARSPSLYLFDQQQQQDADVDNVPADERQPIGCQPVDSSAIDNRCQRVDADKDRQQRQRDDAAPQPRLPGCADIQAAHRRRADHQGQHGEQHHIEHD